MKMCPKVWPKLALSGHQIYDAFQEAGKGLKWYILQFFLFESDPGDSNEHNQEQILQEFLFPLPEFSD